MARGPSPAAVHIATLAVTAALFAVDCPAGPPMAIAPTVARGLQLPRGATPQSIALDRRLDDPLPLHLHGDPEGHTVTVSTCADYEKLRTRVDGSDNALDWDVVKDQGATCDALALMRRAIASPQSALPSGDFLTWRATDLFPGSLWAAFSDEAVARLAAPKATLRGASGQSAFKVVPNHFLEVEDAGAGVHLTLMGLGDIDHDGWQDAVVLVEGYAKGGSNRTTRVAVLTRRAGEPRLREVPVDALLK